MIINAHTTIGQVLRHNPGSLDAIISLSTRFRKLRNPVLRKLMAARTSIETAARMGGCTVNDFFDKLEPLGFTADRTEILSGKKSGLPLFIRQLDKKKIEEMDVRGIISSGKDPLQPIMKKSSELKPGQVLKLVNTFEPVPLMRLLENKGFCSYADIISDDLVETYFYRKENAALKEEEELLSDESWDNIIQDYQGKIVYINVQQLEMPQPMMKILESLDALPGEHALFVYHKRVPVFLLPELRKRGFDFRIREIDPTEVHLLIFPNDYGSAG